jgi:hypothetical protein
MKKKDIRQQESVGNGNSEVEETVGGQLACFQR